MASPSVVDVHQVAAVVKNRIENVLIIDSRSFIEHNACHVATSVNVCCSKIVKRRLQQDKLSVKELLAHTCHRDIDETYDVVVYDQQSKDLGCLLPDSFTVILLKKLQLTFQSVNLLSGGFSKFQAFYPELCEDKTRKCPPLTSLSQPCLPISNQGPTRILPFLYLGSQFDALNKEILNDHNITYELNVSTTCPKPDFMPESHFMRIPVNDNYSEKLLPYFPQAFDFLDKVREGSGCVLVHCLAGISRSPTVAIAYVMRYLHLTSDDGYRYVKSKRPTISPNFNFLGQLLEYEKQLRRENILDNKEESSLTPAAGGKKRLCRTDMRTSKLSLDISVNKNSSQCTFIQSSSGDQSPTTALAKLSFGRSSASEVAQSESYFTEYQNKSCYGEWLRGCDDVRIDYKSVRDSQTLTASTTKPLSPVKEIKCESLISEISSGQDKVNVLGKGNFVKKIATFYKEKFTGWPQSSGKEKCSVTTESPKSPQILCHSRSEADVTKNSNNLTRISSHFLGSSATESQKVCSRLRNLRKDILVFTKSESCGNFESLKKSNIFTFPTAKSPVQDSKLSVPFSHFNFPSSNYKRSDSVATSGFGSESSDCADNFGEEMMPSCSADSNRAGFDVEEELEDEVILRSGVTGNKTVKAARENDSAYFSLTLPDVAVTEYPKGIESPLSPSETHLLEDLIADAETATTNSNISSPFTKHTAAFHESFHQVSSSPSSWFSSSNSTSDLCESHCRRDSFGKDKRKYEPVIQSSPYSLEIRQKKATNSSKKIFASESFNFATGVGSTKVGLYRVQSCPGFMTQFEASSSLNGNERNLFWDVKKPRLKQKITYRGLDYISSYQYNLSESELSINHKGTLFHESCPDVLHLECDTDIPPSSVSARTYQRNFRRSRLIQVS